MYVWRARQSRSIQKKMKRVILNISEEESVTLKRLAEEYTESMKKSGHGNKHICPKRIIEQFVSDLTRSEQSGDDSTINLAVVWFRKAMPYF